MQTNLKQRVQNILRSVERLVEGATELEKHNGDKYWLFFVRKESSILLRRAFKLWLHLMIRRK